MYLGSEESSSKGALKPEYWLIMCIANDQTEILWTLGENYSKNPYTIFGVGDPLLLSCWTAD